MTGQGVIGRDCAWCGLPAVCEIEVSPAEYRTVTRTDPVTGERVPDRRVSRFAVRVPACDTHKTVTAGQPPPVSPPCQRQARDFEQPALFVTADEAWRRNAIHGESTR